MPVINVKRFSRSKVPDATVAANDATPVHAPQNIFKQNITTAAPANDDDEGATDIDDDDDLFKDLGRTAFEASVVAEEHATQNAILETQRIKEETKAEKEMAKKLAAMQKKAESKKQRVSTTTPAKRTPTDDNDDSVFSDQGSEILGRDKRQLITKVVQYKQLFPTQLKTFKVKKNQNKSTPMLNLLPIHPIKNL